MPNLGTMTPRNSPTILSVSKEEMDIELRGDATQGGAQERIEVDTEVPLTVLRHPRRRYAQIGHRVVQVGCLITGFDGLQLDTEGNEMRQLSCTPSEHGSSETWASCDGVVRQRYRNWLTTSWTWGMAKVPDENFTLQIGTSCSGGTSKRVPLARAIALAWVAIPEALSRETACAGLVEVDEACISSNIGWFSKRDVLRQRTAYSHLSDSDDSDDEREAAPESLPHEVWRRLRYSRRSVNTIVANFCPRESGDYAVSSEGRVKNPDGHVIQHYLSTSGMKQVDIADFGSVPVAQVVVDSFASRDGVAVSKGGGVASYDIEIQSRQRGRLRNSEAHVFRSFLEGSCVDAIARERGVLPATVLTYLYSAATVIDLEDIPSSFWNRIVPPSVKRAMQELYTERDDTLDARLADLKDKIDVRCSYCGTWTHETEQWGVLRLAKLFVMRKHMHKRGRKASKK